MTTVPLEIGNIVHDVVKVLLERLQKNPVPVDASRFMEYAARKTGEYRQARTFAEVYYHNRADVTDEDLLPAVRRCLENLLSSDRYRWVVEKAAVNRSGWIIEPPGYGETRINGLKAYCKVDFLFPVDGMVHILDWKTGKPDPDKHRKQMVGYSSWASYHFGCSSEAILPKIAYLNPAYTEQELAVTTADLQQFVQAVAAETGEMYALLANVEKNIPKEKAAFPLIPTAGLCRYCNYRELCGRAAPAAVVDF
jgi:hypothetical protein